MGKSNAKRLEEVITQTHTGLVTVHVLTRQSRKPHISWDIKQRTQFDFTLVVRQN